LDVPVSNEAELKALCESVERAVLERQKVLRGDLVFDYLIGRLRLYEGSNYPVSTMYRSLIGKGEISSFREIKVVELPLDSAIKDEKTLQKILKKNLKSSQLRAKTPQKNSFDLNEP
jgi:hypothetical protein